ncbi:hypothetical protein CDIK_1254 [Cucumispora dikerogammari]|nr:hypothetical protein CDIK_1254 [Cucumispora dikerogammari]
MSKTPKISDVTEKHNILFFLRTGEYYTSDLTTIERKIIRRKSEHFIKSEGNLFIEEIDNIKRYFCSYRLGEINSALSNYHLPVHIQRNLLRTHINQDYAGITVEHINSYLASCLNCLRE